jgi:chemotaxis signal transduction protein
VVDVGALLLGGESPAWTRFVTVRTKRADVVLAVEDVLGVGSLADAALRDLPPLTKSSHAESVTAVGARDHDLLFVLDSVRLIPESLWDRMATAKR